MRRLHAAGRPVIGVDADALRRLAPDLLITQDLCEVCAVAEGEVHRLAAAVHPAPAVLSLSGRTIEGIWADIRAVARALDLEAEGDELVAGLRSRLDRLRARRGRAHPPGWCASNGWSRSTSPATGCPRWSRPPGGEDVGARAGSHSARREWSELAALRPDLFVVMLCGFGVERTIAELAAFGCGRRCDRCLGRVPVWILDGNAYTSRPGPRVVDGAELLQGALAGRRLAGW